MWQYLFFPISLLPYEWMENWSDNLSPQTSAANGG
jgi:hypothetical protein